MCLYPKLVTNKKYVSNGKNGGNIPAVSDIRLLKAPTKCRKCIECRKQLAREWHARLLEDIKDNINGVFVTLTFSNESIVKLKDDYKIYKIRNKDMVKIKIDDLKGYDFDNAIASRGVRLFNELWRKHNGKAVRHWLVTELGHNGTENIHLHGIIWTDKLDEIKLRWKHGHVWTRRIS